MIFSPIQVFFRLTFISCFFLFLQFSLSDNLSLIQTTFSFMQLFHSCNFFIHTGFSYTQPLSFHAILSFHTSFQLIYFLMLSFNVVKTVSMHEKVGWMCTIKSENFMISVWCLCATTCSPLGVPKNRFFAQHTCLKQQIRFACAFFRFLINKQENLNNYLLLLNIFIYI